jgi:hypothetical protein
MPFRQFDLNPFFPQKGNGEYIGEIYFIDKQNLLVFHRKNGSGFITMTELDPQTESARIKYEYLDNPTGFYSTGYIQRNGNPLFVIKETPSEATEYSMYKIDVNKPLIEKYYETITSGMHMQNAGVFEDKILAFHRYGDRRIYDSIKTLFCFDLKAKKMDKFELDLPEWENRINKSESVCFKLQSNILSILLQFQTWDRFLGTWLQAEFYGIIQYDGCGPSVFCDFLVHFNWI